MNLPRILPFAHSLIERALQEGDSAIDGTVGNGHDTLFLAQRVGTAGRVYGFDLQQAAIEAARKRLTEGGAETQTILYRAGHETIQEHISEEERGRIKAAMFNLGYLPGSDKSCITRRETTIAALEATLSYLAIGGIMTVVLYPGHPGGDEEAEAVLTWAETLDAKKTEVLLYNFINRKKKAPLLLIFQKTC